MLKWLAPSQLRRRETCVDQSVFIGQMELQHTCKLHLLQIQLTS